MVLLQILIEPTLEFGYERSPRCLQIVFVHLHDLETPASLLDFGLIFGCEPLIEDMSSRWWSESAFEYSHRIGEHLQVQYAPLDVDRHPLGVFWSPSLELKQAFDLSTFSMNYDGDDNFSTNNLYHSNFFQSLDSLLGRPWTDLVYSMIHSDVSRLGRLYSPTFSIELSNTLLRIANVYWTHKIVADGVLCYLLNRWFVGQTQEEIKGPSILGLNAQAVQARGDLGNRGLDVADSQGLFEGPEYSHQAPGFIEFVILRAQLHCVCSAQAYLQEGSSTSCSRYCVRCAEYAVSGSHRKQKSH